MSSCRGASPLLLYTNRVNALGFGIAILLGLWTRPALVLDALEIIVLIFGIALTQNWPAAGIPIVYAIELAFAEYNRWSVDQWRTRQRNSRRPS